MSLDYKTKAIEYFPHLKEKIDECQNTMQLWIELDLELEKAYQKEDRSYIDSLFRYMKWCFDHLEQLPKAQGDDMYQSITVTVLENLPTIKNAWPDIPKYFSPNTFRELRRAFMYHITQREYDQIESLYKKKRGKNSSYLF